MKPTVSVYIGTSVNSDNFILDDATYGKLDTGGELGDTLGYVLSDITDSVIGEEGLNINRGGTRSQGPYFRGEAGTCSFRLDNQDGDFDPLNDSGTWVVAGQTQLRPGLPVVVKASINGSEEFTLFVGEVEEWDVSYPVSPVPGQDSYVDVVATDGIGQLAAADPLASPEQGAGDSAGERINRILDNVAWSEQFREIDTDGSEELIATEMAQPAWTEILRTSDSVNGWSFVDRFGYPTYKLASRFPRTGEVLFCEVSGIPPTELKVTADPDQIYNVVKLARDGGTVQGVRDETSIALYGERSFSRNDLLLNSDDQVSEQAGFVLSQFKDIQFRVENITVEAGSDTTQAHWQELLELDILRRVATRFDTPDGRSIRQEGLVRGISLRIRPFLWTWQISAAKAPDVTGLFILDDILNGVLDTDTLAAY